jgi:hypothetical protein
MSDIPIKSVAERERSTDAKTSGLIIREVIETAHDFGWCYASGMRAITIEDAEGMLLVLQDEIRRSE